MMKILSLQSQSLLTVLASTDPECKSLISASE